MTRTFQWIATAVLTFAGIALLCAPTHAVQARLGSPAPAHLSAR